jgi:excisionase family DNA binding protein
MRALVTVPSSRACHARSRVARRRPLGTRGERRSFSPLIDARAAGKLLGVPHTWLLAQARAGRIPHHRLGHYVRFNVDDLARWLRETRLGPGEQLRRGRMR